MNITPHAPNLPLATVVNPPTEVLRRDNQQREIITQVTATNPSAADKGVASEKERSRTPAQTNEQIDFTSLRKQAEDAASSINEQESSQDKQQDAKKDQGEAESENSNSVEKHSQEKNSTEEKEQEIAEQRVIAQLQQRDKEVRAHELAHSLSGGSTTGSPSYSFEIGPDGKKYAVSGEVPVDLSVVAGDPEATIAKMQKVHSAALAPANPSTQDIRVAASATQKILAAQSELLSANKDKEEQPNPTQSVQSNEVAQRALRIESYYFTVSQGYERPDNYQFELTA